MISSDTALLMNLNLSGQDVTNFTNIIGRLMLDSKKPGFKKMFSNTEIETINSLGDSIGIIIKEDNTIITADPRTAT